jgi:hypothetical protein
MATISLTFYIGYLFYLCGGYPSRFLPICMWAICLTYYMDCLSSLLYICCLSSYSYGGCPSYLLSLPYSLPIRTGAVSLTLSPSLSLPYSLSLSLPLSHSLPIHTGAASLTLSLSFPHSLPICTGAASLTIHMGYLLCSYCLSYPSLFLLIRALNSADTAAIEPILEYILEMNPLT